MKIINSFKYALAGVVAALKTETNFRIEITAAILAIAASCYFKISQTEWLIVLLSILPVLCLELMNTAIEKACNLFTIEKNSDVKLIKDVAAGAVLIAAIIALINGLIIFLPKIFLLIK